MDYRTLGNSGASVSELTLGTMTFGAEADEPTSHAILDAFVAGGGTLVDTADVYSAGTSETIIGRWLADHPTDADQVVLATKGRFPMGDGPKEHEDLIAEFVDAAGAIVDITSAQDVVNKVFD